MTPPTPDTSLVFYVSRAYVSIDLFRHVRCSLLEMLPISAMLFWLHEFRDMHVWYSQKHLIQHLIFHCS